MSIFKENMVNKVNNDKLWLLLDNNFQKYYIEQKGDKINKIPKKIHQIWLGGELPAKYSRITKTWQEKNPDWEYKLWTDKDVEDFKLLNKTQFDSTTNFGSKADILRYEILYREGGIYIDTDFECLKSFDDLLYLEFFTGTGHIFEPEVFNGLIACAPGHPIIEILMNNISTNDNSYENIIQATGPKYFSKIFFNYILSNPENIVVFPTNYFYPFPAIHRHMVRNDNDTSRKFVYSFNKNCSYCTHLWYTSWQK